MGKVQATIREAYSEHFQYLREIANQVEQLKSSLKHVGDQEVRREIKTHIEALEKELREYAKNLEERGTQLFKNAA